MLRLFGRYLDQTRSDKTLDTVVPEDVEAYQRYLVSERKAGFSSFNKALPTSLRRPAVTRPRLWMDAYLLGGLFRRE